MKQDWIDRLVGLSLTLVVFVVYLMTLSEGAARGDSASLLVSQLGLFPQLSPASPIWSLTARGVAAFSAANAVFMLNLMSACCGAASVYLLYSLMRRGLVFFMDEYLVVASRRRCASITAGLAAALFLAFCMPFWSVSTRAHTAAFDIFLVLVISRLFMGYAQTGRQVYAFAFTILYGLCLAEFATLWVLGPLFGLSMLFVMWKREQLRPAFVALLVGGFVVSVFVMYIGAAGLFYKTDGYHIRGYGSYWQILRYMWRDQLFLITRSLPRDGWLVILFVTVVPWVAMFAVAKRGLNDDQDWGLHILHLIMTALVVGVLLNMPLSPWAMQGWRRLLVTPYVLAAMVYGYLIAFWLLLPGDAKQRDANASSIKTYMRLGSGWMMVVGLSVALLWRPWVNARAVQDPDTPVANALADKVVRNLEGRTWLITDGQIDNHLALAARRHGVPLKVINRRAGGSAIYLEYVASLLDDIRLKNLATLSLSALLREWLSPQRSAYGQIAVMNDSELWARYGYQAVPNGMVFFGSRDKDSIDAKALMTRSVAFWREMLDWLQPFVQKQSNGRVEERSDMARWAASHSAMVANNLGVLMEDLGHSSDAERAYRSALKLDADNVSALLNLAAMIQGGRAEDPDQSVAKALDVLEKNIEQKFHIWSLARHYGTVRAPEAFAQLGWTWAYSGRPEIAIAKMEQASALLPDAQRAGIQGMMAELYLMDNRPLESEAIYKAMLLKDPTKLSALQGMMRIALMQRDYEKAESYRQQSADHGLDPVQAQLQKALIEIATGTYASAQEVLETLLMDERQLVQGWVLLAELGFASDNESLVNRALRRLEAIEGRTGFRGSIIAGRMAFENQDLPAAAEHFENALAHQPGNRRLIETLLRLDLALSRADSIRRHVKALLQEDPGHALALYVRGSLQLADGDLALAEDSLRQSLRRSRLPMALNDLAWLMTEKGNYDEAEGLVNEALAANEQQPAVWDTKGVILLRTGRIEEAEQAFGRSLALFDKNPTVHLHMGEAQLALGKRQPVRTMLEMLEPYQDQLSRDDRELFNRLRERVGTPAGAN